MGRLLVFSGAGISAESGVPTFRDADGLWSRYDLDVVCNAATWRRNLEAVHEFYGLRRVELGRVEPNAAHRRVADWQSRYGARVVTQNIDDLFERAGCRDVLHVHGFLTELRCHGCGHVWDIGYAPWDPARDACPNCGARREVKPNVVFFGEEAPAYAAMFAAFSELEADDVLVSIGTAGEVVPIGWIARELPAHGIFNALTPPVPRDAFDQWLDMPATEAVEVVDRALRERWGA